MKITRTNADIDTTDEVLASTLRLISEQPSDWVIKVTHTGADATGALAAFEVEGTIALFDQDTLVIADTDLDAMHTGASTTIDLHDITEIEVL